MWFTIVSIIYVLVCAFLVLVVLLQQGKGGGMGSAFGGGGSQTVFGGAGAGNFLTRLTAIAATTFMVLSALLAYMSTSGERQMRVAEEVEEAQAQDSLESEADAAGDGTSDTGEATDVPLTTEEVIEQEADDALDQLEDMFPPTGDEVAPEDAPPVEEAPAPVVDEPAEEAAAPAPRPAAARPPRPAAPRAPAPAAAPAPAPAAQPAAQPAAAPAPAPAAQPAAAPAAAAPPAARPAPAAAAPAPAE